MPFNGNLPSHYGEFLLIILIYLRLLLFPHNHILNNLFYRYRFMINYKMKI